MKKVLIIGCPGSGKSYFSRELAEVTGLPLYHIDKIRWRPDWTLMPREEFLPILKDVMERDEWIIDGNYLSSMEFRLSYADTVFCFDLPTDECLDNIETRRGKARSDMPDGMTDRDDPEFIEFIKNYNRDTKPRVDELLRNFKGKIFIIKSRDDKKYFLK